MSALCKLGGGSLLQDGIPVWWFLNRNLFLLLCRGGWLVADSWASFLHQTTLNSSSTVLYSTALEYKAFISERPDSLFRSRSWWFCVGFDVSPWRSCQYEERGRKSLWRWELDLEGYYYYYYYASCTPMWNSIAPPLS